MRFRGASGSTTGNEKDARSVLALFGWPRLAGGQPIAAARDGLAFRRLIQNSTGIQSAVWTDPSLKAAGPEDTRSVAAGTADEPWQLTVLDFHAQALPSTRLKS
ncbi:MAG: hypothetical protein GY937_20525 [bacterium]|nr:hypothetical protein [bacterium]